MRYRLAAAIASLLCTTGGVSAKDLSAETMGIVSGLMAPYRNHAEPSVGSGADTGAVKAAIAILDKEQLVDVTAPTGLPGGLAEKLGKALALGTRTGQFLPEIAEVRNAIVQQDEKQARAAIQNLYVKMGRTKPEGPALNPLYQAALAAVGAEPQETESVTIDRPDYSITIENARSAGEAHVDVLMSQGPDGQPARVEFKGKVVSVPDLSTNDLVTAVQPAASAETMTTKQADELRKQLNGRWRDQDGNPYDISGQGADIIVTDLSAKPRPYTGKFTLGRISGRFNITHADDMRGLPLEVRTQLASRGLHFDISLASDKDGKVLDGTWSSQYVTYSSDLQVESIHDPYDVKLTLSRGEMMALGGRLPQEGP